MAAGPISERNQDATIYVGGLDEKVRINLCRIRIIPEGIESSPLLWLLDPEASVENNALQGISWKQNLEK
jgi:hypothetical protein